MSFGGGDFASEGAACASAAVNSARIVIQPALDAREKPATTEEIRMVDLPTDIVTYRMISGQGSLNSKYRASG
jgi:hypothetical protein